MMPNTDKLVNLLERGAARPQRAADVHAIWRRGQRRGRLKRVGATLGTALTIIAVVAAVAAVWPRSQAPSIGQTAERSDRWGPLAVASGPRSLDGALIHGTLEITDECVVLAVQGEDVLLVWPAEGTTWNPDDETVTFTNRDGTAYDLRTGGPLSFGGGGDSSSESQESAEAWVGRIDWTSPPASSCLTDRRWFVGDIVRDRT